MMFHVYPREFFADDEAWNGVRSLAAARLPSRRRQQQRLFWWTLAGWLALIAILALVFQTLAGGGGR
jgi:hypothetical protein